jgi:hypothetical protein
LLEEITLTAGLGANCVRERQILRAGRTDDAWSGYAPGHLSRGEGGGVKPGGLSRGGELKAPGGQFPLVIFSCR